MADEEFEIDVYGDSAHDGGDNEHVESGHHGDENHHYEGDDAHNGDDRHHDHDYHEEDHQNNDTGDNSNANHGQSQNPLPERPQQGVKRKEVSDDRPVDPGATTALMISDLHWWNTDDDIRGWVRQAGCEHELKDITFSEHKINGKSKGYVSFQTTHRPEICLF